MRASLKTALAGMTSALLLALLLFGRATPANAGAARSSLWQGEAAGRVGTALPAAVSFRESDGRGLLVRTWVNGAGPFTFALDTGAGATLLSSRAASEARVEVEVGGRGIVVGGLSGARAGGAKKAFVRTVALGSRENTLTARGLFVVAPGLPEGVDGVLDLAEGRRALLDTGSGFGLAVDESAARSLGVLVSEGRRGRGARDLAGGEVHARRVRAATVSVGALVLRGVPTDLLVRAEKGAPVILGRDALRPFRLTFDPVNRLIMLDPREG